MRLTTTLLTTFTLALVGCGDDGSPPPIDAPEVDADPNAIDAAPICAGGTLDYGDTCTEGGTECGSCTCHDFGHEVQCVTTCTVIGDCPPNTRRCQGGLCQPN